MRTYDYLRRYTKCCNLGDLAPEVCALLIYLQFAVDSVMITEYLEREGKGSPKLCIFVLITLRIRQGKPPFAAVIRHAILA